MWINKFRGKNLDTGEYVFSETIMQEENYLYRGTKAVWFGGEEKNYPVDAESVAQFVGYDSNGNEVYEGDTIIDRDGHEWVAVLLPKAEMTCGGVYEWLCDKKSAFKLKEADNEKI